MRLLCDRASAFGDFSRRKLWGSDNQDFSIGQQLGHGDGDVTSARRQVQEQDIQVAPVHVSEELLKCAVQHRTAPHHG